MNSQYGEWQNKEASEQYDHSDGMHSSFPRIGQSLSSKHGSPETEQGDAHAYVSMSTYGMDGCSVR